MKPNDKRRNNPGRPKTLEEPTTPIRVPYSLAPWIKENLEKIKRLKEKSEKK
jgi:hypothetical protein